MDSGEIWILQRRLGRYVQGVIDDDSDDLPNVIMGIWKRLRETYGLKIVR